MASATVEHLLDVGFADADRHGLTLAVVALGSDGSVLAERYDSTAGRDEAFISWSMAKSVTHMAAGVAGVDPAATNLFPSWAGDGRAAITVEDLLRMQDGLVWFEDYVDAGTSDVLEMLFGSGADDVVGYAASKPLEVTPGSRWRYSSGTSNLLGDVIRRHAGVAPGDDWRSWLVDNVCRPAGMSAADPRLDAAGSFVASSYLYATALDFARFGLVYLHEGAGIVDPAWVAHARRPTPGVDEPGRCYGAQWWLWPDRPDWLVAQGYETQRTIVAFDREMVLVRLGKTPAELGGDHVDQWLRELVDAL
ncbi:MAG TPA: serine hydrolase [Acidimicrobiales bacterium]|nr:serine hydrolase [Acidimicrobiales bacterium]